MFILYVYDGIHDLLGFVVSDRHGIVFGVGWCACLDVNPIEFDFVLDIKYCSVFILQRKIQSLIVFGLILLYIQNTFRYIWHVTKRTSMTFTAFVFLSSEERRKLIDYEDD
jgi:hypothetical protein